MKTYLIILVSLLSATFYIACDRQNTFEVILSDGEKYWLENKDKEGVITTESGLQYEVLKEGSGPQPTLEDSVTVHYFGKRVDGYQFDSSYDRGEPVSFPLARVIDGWQEGLQLMSVGSKYRFVIPPDLAYGAYGAGTSIGPFEYLIFEVELLEIL